MLIFAMLENPDERKLCESLYLGYRQKMFRVARAILQSDSDAEDAVADAFEKIIKNISKFFSLSGDETTRLIVIYIRSVAISMYRRKKKIVFDELCDGSPDDGESAGYQAPDSFRVEDFVLSASAVETIRREIQRLDPIYRDTLTLKHIYGYSDAELASMYGISEGAVRMRLLRARKRLACSLGIENKDKKTAEADCVDGDGK